MLTVKVGDRYTDGNSLYNSTFVCVKNFPLPEVKNKKERRYSMTLVKDVKADSIQDHCNRYRTTAVEFVGEKDWAQLQIQRAQWELIARELGGGVGVSVMENY